MCELAEIYTDREVLHLTFEEMEIVLGMIQREIEESRKKNGERSEEDT